jgi:uncharacterized protein (TIGR00304 family)
MNIFYKLAFLCVIFGVILLILGAISGEVEGGLFLIFPYLKGSGIYAVSWVLCFFGASLLYILGLQYKTRETADDPFKIGREQPNQRSSKSKIKGGGVILIGPIPLVFGFNWKIALLLLILALIFLVIITFISGYL